MQQNLQEGEEAFLAAGKYIEAFVDIVAAEKKGAGHVAQFWD
jgi:hypothetical protein